MHAVQVGLSKEAGTAEKKPDTERRWQAGKQASRQADSQADSQAGSQARGQASKQAGGQVARQGLTSNPTAHGDLVSLIQKKRFFVSITITPHRIESLLVPISHVHRNTQNNNAPSHSILCLFSFYE